ncbi:DUF5787 family protein [Natrialbaceae archaeon A-gly3]
MSEFAFELEVCAALEDRGEGIIARQLGAGVADPGGRIVDVVCVEPGPAFDERTAITPETIPSAAIEADVGPGRPRHWTEAFDCHPDRARRAIERALEVGFFEREYHDGREYVRQVTRYPDWFGSIVGIENKPDLGRPGDLEEQLRTDVSLALFDEVILATESYVTRAHLNRIPEEVGVWRVRTDREPTEIEVIREPTRLPTEAAGVEPLESLPGRTDIAIVPAAKKARARCRLAERAYGKGWRTFDFSACHACEPDDATGATLPHCTWKGRVVDARSECGPTCDGYEPSEAASVDLETERARRSPWVANPPGKRRRQTGLDRFR